MTIDINPDYLIKNSLTANQFVILQLIYEEEFDKLKKLGKISEVESDIEILKSKNLVVQTDEGLKVTPEYFRTLKGKGFFEELLATFPPSVLRPDGLRDYLRTDRKRAERKYKTITKNRKDIHMHILECLKFELEQRSKNGTLMYMKKLPNWLNSESWKEWEEKLKLNSIFEEEENSYGTDII